MRVFDDILEALSDGKEHSIKEIQDKVKRSQSIVDLVLTALSDACFITVQRSRSTTVGPLEIQSAKLTAETRIFLKTIQDIENQEIAQRHRTPLC